MSWFNDFNDALTNYIDIVSSSPSVDPNKFGMSVKVTQNRLNALVKTSLRWTILVSNGQVYASAESADPYSLICSSNNSPWLLINQATGAATYDCGPSMSTVDVYYSNLSSTLYYSMSDVYDYKTQVLRQPTELSKTLYIQDIINFLYVYKNLFDLISDPGASVSTLVEGCSTVPLESFWTTTMSKNNYMSKLLDNNMFGGGSARRKFVAQIPFDKNVLTTPYSYQEALFKRRKYDINQRRMRAARCSETINSSGESPYLIAKQLYQYSSF